MAFEPPQRDVPKSSFWRQADAVGGHPTQTIICAVYPRSHRAPARIYARAIKAIREEDANETSPPHVLASGCGRCRAPGHLALLLGTSLSDAAGAFDRAVRSRWCVRHYCAGHRAMV